MINFYNITSTSLKDLSNNVALKLKQNILYFHKKDFEYILNDSTFTYIGQSWFLNGKKVNKKKLKTIFNNNVATNSTIKIRKSIRHLPFYIGDWNYFGHKYHKSAYRGWLRAKKVRIYIDVLENQ